MKTNDTLAVLAIAFNVTFFSSIQTCHTRIINYTEPLQLKMILEWLSASSPIVFDGATEFLRADPKIHHHYFLAIVSFTKSYFTGRS